MEPLGISDEAFGQPAGSLGELDEVWSMVETLSLSVLSGQPLCDDVMSLCSRVTLDPQGHRVPKD